MTQALSLENFFPLLL